MDALHLYRALERRGTSPALTWYSTEGRVELSGRVAANHLAKIAGYLLEDVWIEPGTVVLLDCQAGFKQVLWGLGALLAGAHVAVGQTPSGGLAAVVTDAPERWAGSTANGVEVLAVDPAPLAMQWTGESLPPGVRDAAAEVVSASDVLMDEAAHEASNWQLWGGVSDLDLDRDLVSRPTSGPSPGSGPSRGSASTGPSRGSASTGPGSGSGSDRDFSSGSPALGAAGARARLLVAPSPSQALEAAAGTLASARLVVVDDAEDAERIGIAENLDEVRH